MTAPTKPTKLPRWADTVEDNTRKVLEPNEGQKDVGYVPGAMDAQRLNWLFNKGYRALEWLFSLFGEESPGGRMTLTRDVTATGALKVQGLTETAGGLSTTGNIAATGNLSATGNATVGGTLGVAGNVTLGTDAMNTHVVNGVTDFKGAVTHSNNTNFAAGKTHTVSGTLDLSGNATVVSVGAWTSTGSLGSHWSSGGLDAAFSFRLLPWGALQLRGTIANSDGTTPDNLVYTLPTGYRPSVQRYAAVATNGAPVSVTFSTNGQMTISLSAATTGQSLHFDSVTFTL